MAEYVSCTRALDEIWLVNKLEKKKKSTRNDFRKYLHEFSNLWFDSSGVKKETCAQEGVCVCVCVCELLCDE